MKIFITSLIFLVAASAANADDKSSSNLGAVLGSLSSLLSSTNPQANYNVNEPKSGEAPVMTATTTPTRISQLPPLVPEPEPLNVPMPKNLPKLVPIDSTDEAAIKLSPSTRKLIEMTPSNLGGHQRQLSGKLQIMHGEFENGGAVSAPANKAEVVAAPPAKPRFDISVHDTMHSDSNEVMLDKALTALKMGQYESAVTMYKTVLVSDPKNRDALFGTASAYHKAGQRAEAKAAYTKLMASYPTFRDGLNNVLLFAAEEAPDDALVELNKLSQKNPQFAPIFAQKAAIYLKKGDNNSATQNMIKALSLEPENVLYQYNLATCYDRLGDNQDAVKMYNNLIEQSYKGQALPVPREALSERIAYLGSLKLSQTAMR